MKELIKYGHKITLQEVAGELKPVIYTQNLALGKALRKEGFQVAMELNLKSYLELNELVLITDKKEAKYKRIKTLVEVMELNEDFTNDFGNYYLVKPPGINLAFGLKTKNEWQPGDFLELNGVLKDDDKINGKRRSNLEKQLEYYHSEFDCLQPEKKIELLKDTIKYSRPRYELHLHTLHSQRDAHITHNQIKEAFESGKLAITAITNHGINNCFPDSIHAFKKSENKVIPAVEIYLVDEDQLKAEQEIWELKNQSIFDKLESNKELLDLLEDRVADVEELEFDNSKLESEIELAKEDTSKEGKLKLKELKAELKIYKDQQREQKNEAKEQKAQLKKQISETKKLVVELESEIKALEKTKPNLGDAKRHHAVLLLKSEDTKYQENGYDFEYNPGIVALNQLITEANTVGLAVPVQKKWLGTRPCVFLNSLKKVKEYFIIGGACSFGLVTDALIEKDLARAEQHIDLFDYLEVQPSSNNSYLTENEEYKQNFPTLNEVYALNREIYDFAKKHNKLVCFTSDAHVIDKTERYKRSMFKKSYINMIISRNSNEDSSKVLEDNKTTKQPFLHSYDEMVLELTTQGFNATEIEELYQNEKTIAESCKYFNSATIIPNQMFIPEFPGLDVKTELPKLAYKNLYEKYGPNPEPLIVERMQTELEALAKRNFEFIYYVSGKLVEVSEQNGFGVGSRGFAPPNWLP